MSLNNTQDLHSIRAAGRNDMNSESLPQIASKQVEELIGGEGSLAIRTEQAGVEGHHRCGDHPGTSKDNFGPGAVCNADAEADALPASKRN